MQKPIVDIESLIKILRRRGLTAVPPAPEPDGRPEPRVGGCVVCGGKVTEEFVMSSDTPSELIPIGSASRRYYSWQSTGLSCQRCGIAYAKLPSAGMAKPWISLAPAIVPARRSRARTKKRRP